MKKLLRLALYSLLPILLFASCEESVDPDTPFVERLVVNGLLREGESIRVSITKTLPLDRIASREEGWVGDIQAAIVIDAATGGSQRIPLVYRGDSGIYIAATPLRAESGNRYRLEASWHGLNVTASTLVPYPVPIDSIRLVPRPHPYDDRDTGGYTFAAMFRPVGEQVYALSYDVNRFSGGGSISTYGRGTIARRADTISGGIIDLTLDGYMDFPPEQIDAVLYSFDTPYYDFYQTYYLNNNGDGAFSGGSDLTRWNVEGDGIGLFIGEAISKRPLR